MASEAHDANDERVLVVAPTRRDVEVTCALLAQAGVDCIPAAGLNELAAQIPLGAGALIVTEAALVAPDMPAVLAALAEQPPWSDIPTVVLARDHRHAPAAERVLNLLNNVTLLDRPVSTRSMVSAVQAALRARRRQYQMRDQLAQQLRAEQALIEADRRKDEFLATLAHELRNPLAPIRTGLQLLSKQRDDVDRVTRLGQMMERQVAQLVKLIDELLDVSRIATGKVVLHRERVDMRSVVQTALESSQPAVDAANHVVRTSLPARPVWVHGDPHRLAQVVSNVVNNAAKYTPDHGQITVELREDAGDALVEVRDNGVGIPSDMLDDVFDLFTQVDRTLDRAQGGLGIGLSLVRRLMELHGGSVVAHSPGLERGSTFAIRLPALPAAAGQPQLPADHGPAARPVRVLVVDDNADAADTLAMLMQANGHSTHTEYGGEEALKAIAEFHPDVIFCDIGMPRMDGYALAARLRVDPENADTVLIAVTGWGSDDDRRRTRKAGFDFHLTKPVSFDAVEAILARL